MTTITTKSCHCGGDRIPTIPTRGPPVGMRLGRAQPAVAFVSSDQDAAAVVAVVRLFNEMSTRVGGSARVSGRIPEGSKRSFRSWTRCLRDWLKLSVAWNVCEHTRLSIVVRNDSASAVPVSKFSGQNPASGSALVISVDSTPPTITLSVLQRGLVSSFPPVSQLIIIFDHMAGTSQ